MFFYQKVLDRIRKIVFSLSFKLLESYALIFGIVSERIVCWLNTSRMEYRIELRQISYMKLVEMDEMVHKPKWNDHFGYWVNSRNWVFLVQMFVLQKNSSYIRTIIHHYLLFILYVNDSENSSKISWSGSTSCYEIYYCDENSDSLYESNSQQLKCMKFLDLWHCDIKKCIVQN